jgi:hypothetical protein
LQDHKEFRGFRVLQASKGPLVQLQDLKEFRVL